MDPTQQAARGDRVVALWISFQVAEETVLGFIQGRLIHSLALGQAVFIEGVFLGMVERRAGDHVHRCFLQPRQRGHGDGGKPTLGIYKAPAVKVGSGEQVGGQFTALGGCNQLGFEQHFALPVAGAKQFQACIGQQHPLIRRHIGLDYLADKRRGTVHIVAAATAAFAPQKLIACRCRGLALDAQRGQQLRKLRALFLRRLPLGRAGHQAIHRERHRAKTLGQVIFAQCVGGQGRILFCREQQAQVGPAVIAGAQEWHVAAGGQRILGHAPVGVARVVAAGLGLQGKGGTQCQGQG